jgi:hypothetical protein
MTRLSDIIDWLIDLVGIFRDEQDTMPQVMTISTSKWMVKACIVQYSMMWAMDRCETFTVSRAYLISCSNGMCWPRS